jgi:hypothetical protein
VTTYANLDAHEGVVSGAKTITLLRKSRELQITNDSGGNNLQFKFNTSEAFATLLPTETISMRHITKVIFLSGSGPYRVWSRG